MRISRRVLVVVRPYALALIGGLASVSAACASSADNVPSTRPLAAAPMATMQPIPDQPAQRERRGGRRGFDRAAWEETNGVNGTLRPYRIAGVTYTPRHDPDYQEEGIATWYGPGFEGRRTASGEVFRGTEATAAHRTLRMGSIIEVTNLDTGDTARLRVNDRGPFHRGRILDVSREGARQLGLLRSGSARVRVRYVGEPGEDRPLLARAAEGVVNVATAPVRLAAAVVAAPVRMAASALTPDGGEWAVQTGAFADRTNAERLAERLRAAGEVRILPTDTGLHRVLVGAWRSEQEAAEGLSRVAALGVAGARVVRGF